MTAPMVVDTDADRDLFLRQHSIRAAQEKRTSATLTLGGIGHIGPGSCQQSFALLDADEWPNLRQAAARSTFWALCWTMRVSR